MKIDRLIHHQMTLVKAQHCPTPIIIPLLNAESEFLIELAGMLFTGSIGLRRFIFMDILQSVFSIRILACRSHYTLFR